MTIVLETLSVDDIALVDTILDGLQDYSMKVDGVRKMTDGARHLLTATPPGYAATSKFVFAVLNNSEPVGVVDLIRDFPSPSIAYIGLLAIIEPRQHRGYGREALKAVEGFARHKLGAKTLRLAVVTTNPVKDFWCKMGFRSTGDVRPYAGERVVSTAEILEKSLPEVPSDER